LQDIDMGLGPKPAPLQPPCINDIANQVDCIRRVLFQKVQQQARLTAGCAKMNLGKEECPMSHRRVTMVRLCDHGHWFASTESDTDPDQPRVGRRMALLAVVPGENSPICLVSTHLESNADAPYRDVQFDMLMDAIDAFAPKMPVLIGGDLNTGNHLPPDFDWRRETLFARADARGFSGQTRALIPALAPSAKPLSDHDAVCCRVHSGRVTKVSHS
jgi:hypothetical protein